MWLPLETLTLRPFLGFYSLHGPRAALGQVRLVLLCSSGPPEGHLGNWTLWPPITREGQSSGCVPGSFGKLDTAACLAGLPAGSGYEPLWAGPRRWGLVLGSHLAPALPSLDDVTQSLLLWVWAALAVTIGYVKSWFCF